MRAHVNTLREQCQAANLDYFLVETDRPLDAVLREYLSIRHDHRN